MTGTWPSRALIRSGLLAVVLVAADVALFSRVTEDPKYTSWVTQPVNPVVIALASAPAVPVLVWRLRAPAAALGVLTLHDLLLTCLLGTRPLLSPMAALYTVSSRRTVSAAVGCLAATLAVHGVAVAYEVYPLSPEERPLDGILISAVLIACDTASVLVGRWVAGSRAREQRLVASRAEAIAAERRRIARELHDIVAHSVTVMVLQSAGARRTMATDPAKAGVALQAVEDVGVQAMAELRRLLTVLRPAQDSEGGAVGPGIDRPPGLAMLPGLVAQVEAVGVAATIEWSGLSARLDQSVDITAYRVVQEALTNVTRHGGPGSTARIRLHWAGPTLEIQVTDDGAGVPTNPTKRMSSGLGLIGLRERVTVIGGELAVGRLPGGGYRLTATLPTATVPPPEAAQV
ncbi:sensor histidine kinase [Streptomyces sp. NBC_00564]|uniref:sensor histidine kinase n=1 Tax=unclassified Streptomyces TaxID=2593676 RepID=UPI002FCD77B2|nr:sensor histidine kinase [Streptomyces sp. NBC_00564]